MMLTDEKIKQLIEDYDNSVCLQPPSEKNLYRLCRMIEAAVREECAKVCESMGALAALDGDLVLKDYCTDALAQIGEK